MGALANAGAFDVPQQEEQDVIYLWPSNVLAWRYWEGVQTQWNVGMAGATGLRYEGVRAYLDECGLQGPERGDVWRGICACESATLAAWAELRDQKKP